VFPMFGREVVEGEQRAPVLPQAFGGLLLLDHRRAHSRQNRGLQEEGALDRRRLQAFERTSPHDDL
jgi:hypothetical protein